MTIIDEINKAIHNNNEAALEDLIQQNPLQQEEFDIDSHPVLHLLKSNVADKPKVLRNLINAGLNVGIIDKSRNLSLLHYLLITEFNFSSIDNSVKTLIIKEICLAAPDCLNLSYSNSTPLVKAVENYDAAAVNSLIELGATNVKLYDPVKKKFKSPLEIALSADFRVNQGKKELVSIINVLLKHFNDDVKDLSDVSLLRLYSLVKAGLVTQFLPAPALAKAAMNVINKAVKLNQVSELTCITDNIDEIFKLCDGFYFHQMIEQEELAKNSVITAVKQFIDKYEPEALKLFDLISEERFQEVINKILNDDIWLNVQGENDKTLLMYSLNNTDLLKLLLEKGANPDLIAIRDDGNWPLKIATFKDKDEVIELLLKHGADPNLEEQNGFTALIWALWEHDTKAAIKMTNKGFDINYQNKKGATALMYAAAQGFEDVVELMLEKGAKLNLQDQEGYTALIEAIKNNNFEIVEMLLNKGADPNLQDQAGCTALMAMDDSGYLCHDYEICKLLLSRGGNPNLQNLLGETPLMLMIDSQFKLDEDAYKHIELLFANGANPNLQNSEGKTALMLIIEFLMHAAEQEGYHEYVELILNHGADPNIQDDEGQTALMYAASAGLPEVVKLLLDHGADPRLKDNQGKTAMQLAIEIADNEMTELMLMNQMIIISYLSEAIIPNNQLATITELPPELPMPDLSLVSPEPSAISRPKRHAEEGSLDEVKPGKFQAQLNEERIDAGKPSLRR